MWKFYILRGIVFSDNILAIALQSKICNCLFISSEEMWLQGDDLPEVTLWVGNEVRTLPNLSGHTAKQHRDLVGPSSSFPIRAFQEGSTNRSLQKRVLWGATFSLSANSMRLMIPRTHHLLLYTVA